MDEAALFDALAEGRLAGAALDSFAPEPPPRDHRLFTLPDLIATPHVGGASRSALRNMAVQSATHVARYLESGIYDPAALANAMPARSPARA